MDCPMCGKEYSTDEIQSHADKCLSLNEDDNKMSLSRRTSRLEDGSNNKRPYPIGHGLGTSRRSSEPLPKKAKQLKLQFCSKNIDDNGHNKQLLSNVSLSPNSRALGIQELNEILPDMEQSDKGKFIRDKKFLNGDHVPLAERVRPTDLLNYVGQHQVVGPKSVLFQLLEKKEIPSMILWGPPGCGKTSLASVISNICKQVPGGRMRYVKLSAAMCGVSEVKEAVSRAANDLKFGRKTVLFIDEIHRFNKLQQDIFLPHIEAGTITLVGATTENPCFNLNSALLSRCRVVVLEKLKTPDIVSIIQNAVTYADGKVDSASGRDVSLNTARNDDSRSLEDDVNDPVESEKKESSTSLFVIDQDTVQWLAETCDGDARIALGGLELAIQSTVPKGDDERFLHDGPAIITLDGVKDGLKKSHVLYDKKGDQHYDMISALHKSVRASDENAALYWLARMVAGGEDPMYIARRLVRMASEDVGLADPKALGLAISVMEGCKMIGMPECDVLLAQCAVYLARAPKSRLMEDAFRAAQRLIAGQKGRQPAVPVHLRGTGSSRLIELLGNGKGYNMLHKDDSGLNYMPEGLEDVNFFGEDELSSITG